MHRNPQIDKVVDNFANGLRVVVQIQHYGGEESRYTTNDPEDRTSYSWRRDTTVVQVRAAARPRPGGRLLLAGLRRPPLLLG
jgi:hypothetical protein